MHTFDSDITLHSPLTTILTLGDAHPGPCTLVVNLTVPPDAPPDLGLGAWRANPEGQWFQQVMPEKFGPGEHHLRLALDESAPLVGEGHRGLWTGDMANNSGKIGVFLFSEQPSSSLIHLQVAIETAADPAPTSSPGALTNLHQPATATTGARWSMSVVPVPYPANPFDPAEFTLDLTITQPDGHTMIVAGFNYEPTEGIDRGDGEEFRSLGPPEFRFRYRPRQAGTYRLHVTARWAGHNPVVRELPPLEVTGDPWDGIVQIDRKDPRFFSIDGKFYWPAGPNFNSTYDVRSESRLNTVRTPDRGSFTREAMLTRLAAGGGTLCETWLSPWNMGLEWIGRWPGYRSTGRYHAGHAWAIDQFLDRAEELGIKVNLTIFNHGMARSGKNAEQDWKYHPYNMENGGWLEKPSQLFTDERAFTCQKNLFRYLCARYADSPAILGWKLWAEVNLTNASTDEIANWHRRASTALHELDPWNHPITTHWSGDWRTPSQMICSIPSLDYLTIDAYKGNESDLSTLLNQSTRDPLSPLFGLRKYNKPVLVAEFGGSAGGTDVARMRAEHLSGPWIGLVSGHAGSPLLWWFEWIDQNDLYGIYGAINCFVAGEDLRGAEADCKALSAESSVSAELWCRAWTRPGRLLGYVLASEWGRSGNEVPLGEVKVIIGQNVAPGEMIVEWWDADLGTVRKRESFAHPGGPLSLTAPPVSRHLAFKLIRVPSPAP